MIARAARGLWIRAVIHRSGDLVVAPLPQLTRRR
jgi:hypothetical protein